jgi:hypothetical protein
VSGLTVFGTDQMLGESRAPDADGQTVFRGIVAVDDTTGMAVPVIARVEIVNGTGWPAGSFNDGVPLDDFVFGVPVPAGETTSTTTVPGATTTSTTLATFACGLVPATGCAKPIVSGRASLVVRSKPNGRDGLVWRWASGAATAKEDYGDPPGGTDLIFCLYDAAGLAFTTEVPGGVLCPKRPCWRTTRAGFRFRDRFGLAADGIRALSLVAGGDGRARITLVAAGPALGLPSLPLDVPVTAQLVRGDGGRCWDARMSIARKNTATRFRARAD